MKVRSHERSIDISDQNSNCVIVSDLDKLRQYSQLGRCVSLRYAPPHPQPTPRGHVAHAARRTATANELVARAHSSSATKLRQPATSTSANSPLIHETEIKVDPFAQ